MHKRPAWNTVLIKLNYKCVFFNFFKTGKEKKDFKSMFECLLCLKIEINSHISWSWIIFCKMPAKKMCMKRKTKKMLSECRSMCRCMKIQSYFCFKCISRHFSVTIEVLVEFLISSRGTFSIQPCILIRLWWISIRFYHLSATFKNS